MKIIKPCTPTWHKKCAFCGKALKGLTGVFVTSDKNNNLSPCFDQFCSEECCNKTKDKKREESNDET